MSLEVAASAPGPSAVAVRRRSGRAPVQAFLSAVALVMLAVAAGAAPAAAQSGKIDLSAEARARAEREPVEMMVALQPLTTPADIRSKRGIALMRSEATASVDGFLERVDAGRMLGRDRTGARVYQRFDHAPVVAMRLTRAEAERIAGDPAVAAVLEDRMLELQLVNSAPVIQAPQVWALGPEGAGTTVAILDTGVDHDHSMFAGKIIGSACFGTTSTGSGTRTLCPDGSEQQLGGRAGNHCEAFGVSGCDHGTHVAGIAAGRTVSTTSSSYRGVAPSARVFAVNVFSGRNSDNRAVSFESDQIAAFDHLLPQVGTLNLVSINMSLGGSPRAGACDTDPLKTYIDQMRAAGVATVIAAGNDSSTVGVSSPGCISTAVTVGATDNSDAIASFSNVGEVLDLLAPGVGITSAIPGQRIGGKNGTSMATPQVAGAFALLKSAVPAATIDQIEAALKSSGVAISDARVNPALVRPRISLLAALQTLGGATPAFVSVTPDQVATFAVAFGSGPSPGTRDFVVTNPGANPVTVDVTASSALIGLSRPGQSGSTLGFSLPGGASETVTVTPSAAGLGFGVHTASVSFTAAGGASTTRGARLDIVSPVAVTPTTAASLVGPVGGPFRAMENIDPGTNGAQFSLSNSSASAIAASITAQQTWLQVVAGGSTGQIVNHTVPSGASTIAATASPAAASLPLGVQRSTVTFATAGSTLATATVDLRVTVANDLFSNAATMPQRSGEPSPLFMTASGVSTSNSFFEPGEPAHFSGQPARRSIWYKFVARYTGAVTVDTVGSSFDTLLAAYTGSAVNSLTQLASNDDASGLGVRSRVTFNVTEGTTYHLAVDGFGGATGSVVVNVNPVAAANDAYASAGVIAGASGAVIARTALATSTANDPAHAGATNTRSVWYRWTSPGNGLTTFSTSLNDHDTVLGVYAGGSETTLVETAASDDAAGGSNGSSAAAFIALAGQVYDIAVAAKSGASGGLAQLNWSQTGATTPLLSSISPSSRRTVLNRAVTVFGNILNNSSAPVTNCRVEKPASFTGVFSYQTASAANELTGSPNTPAASIPPGGVQNFVLTAQHSQTLASGELGPRFVCDNMSPAPVFVGLNSWLLRIDNAAGTPDLIAIGATQGTPGVITVPVGGAAAFAIAAVNIGSAASASQMRFSATTPGADIAVSVCETNPANGQCLAPPGAETTIASFATNETRTFTVFVQNPTSNPVAFNPAVTRVFGRFRDAAGNLFGSTSAAVRTQ